MMIENISTEVNKSPDTPKKTWKKPIRSNAFRGPNQRYIYYPNPS